jgi:hypothetical protein
MFKTHISDFQTAIFSAVTVVVYSKVSNINCNLQEFDHAHVLLKNENGYLYRMVQHAGHSMAESLLRVAHEVYCGAVCLWCM